MASLADLFNPTFLMFLGILLLVVALLVVYFESKMREQNHKIASMLSLVSTLAEDMNGVKMGLNHLAIRGGEGFNQSSNYSGENLGNLQQNNLIEVSDDEESDEESDDKSNNEESEESDENEIINEDLESIDENSDNDSEDSNNDIKVVKLQVSNEELDEDNNSYEEANFETEELADLDGDFEPDNDYVEEVLDLKYDNEEKHLEDSIIHSTSGLKTISINLGEEHQHHEENIDYKKLQLPKLRSIAIEKGLATSTDASKLKKHDILKLLGVE